MVKVETIKDSKADHIQHHNDLANAVNELDGDIKTLADSVVELFKNKGEEIDTRLSMFSERITKVVERLTELKYTVTDFMKPKSREGVRKTYYSNRHRQTVDISGVKEIVVGQREAPELGTYMIDSKVYDLKHDEKLKYILPPTARYLEVNDPRNMVITAFLKTEAYETMVSVLSFDLEVFIHKVA